jgi:hypothetical protein
MIKNRFEMLKPLNYQSEFEFCYENNCVNVCKFLLPFIDPAIRCDIPLRYASHQGYTQIVKMLLACPTVNPVTSDNSPIF